MKNEKICGIIQTDYGLSFMGEDCLGIPWLIHPGPRSNRSGGRLISTGITRKANLVRMQTGEDADAETAGYNRDVSEIANTIGAVILIPQIKGKNISVD